ncbi:hypothetical protein EV216_12442 [Rhodovulum steppense]|uniref:Uncharacterized protein n=1 Tax=Rhodovulum steppense TaxID=540251 RepID=A0A4R1YMJ2_9RHOB|nr:hypothetical protein EV216_12442 [Rhodovulum steppense]
MRLGFPYLDGRGGDRLWQVLSAAAPLLLRYVVRAERHQEPRGSDKLYALHEPAVDCISKGEARIRYEFGCKVGLATTLDRGFVFGMWSPPGNRSMMATPLGGH